MDLGQRVGFDIVVLRLVGKVTTRVVAKWGGCISARLLYGSDFLSFSTSTVRSLIT